MEDVLCWHAPAAPHSIQHHALRHRPKPSPTLPLLLPQRPSGQYVRVQHQLLPVPVVDLAQPPVQLRAQLRGEPCAVRLCACASQASQQAVALSQATQQAGISLASQELPPNSSGHSMTQLTHPSSSTSAPACTPLVLRAAGRSGTWPQSRAAGTAWTPPQRPLLPGPACAPCTGG